MTFEGYVLSQTVGVAKLHKIDPAALLAVVEVESAGKSLECDGVTPCLLFERHIFYRELKKAGKTSALANAIALGLANSSWQPATQYKDQGSSVGRLSLLKRAREIDVECANRSCSWGVGQTMGFLAEEMRFPNANAMLNYMMEGGVPAQVDCMIREIENKKLTLKLNLHEWAAFAKVYNGPGYAKNAYDEKMAAAYLKWSQQILPEGTVKPVDVPSEVKPAVRPIPPSAATQAGIGGGIIAMATAIWEAFQRVETQFVVLGLLILVLAAATAIILWRRSKQAVQPRGNLTELEKGITSCY
jgi:hypothetical protein